MLSTTLKLLRREHAQSARLSEILERRIARLAAGDAVNHAIVSGVIAYCLEFPDQSHHTKEDPRWLRDYLCELGHAA